MFSVAVAYLMVVTALAHKAVRPARMSRARKIVVFDADVDPKQHDSIVESCGGCISKALPLINAAACTFSEEDKAMALLTRHGEVKWIEDDIVLEIMGVAGSGMKANLACLKESRPGFFTQRIPWGVMKIGAPSAWVRSTGKGVRVGIVDTGISATHPDLHDNIHGVFDAISETEEIIDDNGHGTHVAGTIAALNNSFGVVGVAPEARIYAVKSFDSRGRGMASDIIQGIEWCIEQGVHIINMSFGTFDSSKALQLAISKAAEAGIILVAASGNSGGQNTVMYPARDPHVIAVAACTQEDRIAEFSSSGPEVDIAGPGENIWSTYKGKKYKILSGTSMACPHVAGAAALVLSVVPELTANDVAKVLYETAAIMNGIPGERQGAGLVNAGAAVNHVV